jgi:hypothetical protein
MRGSGARVVGGLHPSGFMWNACRPAKSIHFVGSNAGFEGAGGEVAGAPEVPACDGAPGAPTFGALLHDVGLGEVGGGDFVGRLELAEGEGEAFADAVVAGGEDVGGGRDGR